MFFWKISCYSNTRKKKTHICPWANPGLLAGRPGSAVKITQVAPPHFGRGPRAHPGRSLPFPVWETTKRHFCLCITLKPKSLKTAQKKRPSDKDQPPKELTRITLRRNRRRGEAKNYDRFTKDLFPKNHIIYFLSNSDPTDSHGFLRPRRKQSSVQSVPIRVQKIIRVHISTLITVN